MLIDKINVLQIMKFTFLYLKHDMINIGLLRIQRLVCVTILHILCRPYTYIALLCFFMKCVHVFSGRFRHSVISNSRENSFSMPFQDRPIGLETKFRLNGKHSDRKMRRE